MLKEYLLENWALILITVAFAIILKTTIFLERKRVNRMYVLIASVFILSVVVFLEFYLGDQGIYREERIVLMAVRYSATPFIMAMILYTLIRKSRWFVFVPAIVFAVVNFISVFTGIVFSIDDANTLQRGPLGYLPYIAVGLYSIFLVYTMFRNSTKQASEIIPILFMALAFVSGLVLPFVIGKEYSKIFCTTIIVALFVYYVFLILQLTSKDALTGLLNRQAYYAAVSENMKTITGIVSIDMNGLKPINDNEGHEAGDLLLKNGAILLQNVFVGDEIYRAGGDEFMVLLTFTTEDNIVEKIAKTKKLSRHYGNVSFAMGYCYQNDSGDITKALKTADEKMYEDKEKYYAEHPEFKR